LRALLLAYRHPGTPLYAKLWLALVIGYALSPIDIIPDFVPVLGHLDDAILLPLGIALAVRMIPRQVMAECRARAAEKPAARRPARWAVGALILLAWIAAAVALALLTGWAVRRS